MEERKKKTHQACRINGKGHTILNAVIRAGCTKKVAFELRPENGKRANIQIPGNRELQAEATVRGKGLETAVHCGDKLTHGDR